MHEVQYDGDIPSPVRIRRLHREEFEHGQAERKHVRGHRWRRSLDELRGVPADDGCREGDNGRFTDDVGEGLGESEIGERDDSLGMKEVG